MHVTAVSQHCHSMMQGHPEALTSGPPVLSLSPLGEVSSSRWPASSAAWLLVGVSAESDDVAVGLNGGRPPRPP